MNFKRAVIKDFRNLENAVLELSLGGNLFYGPNAAGKTNLVEALALACTGRTLKPGPQRLLVRDGAENAYCAALIQSEKQGELRTEIYLPRKGSRKYLLNQRPSSKRELFTTFAVVLFGEEDLELVRGPAQQRRFFLNFFLSQLSKPYYAELAAYTKALAQRNALLRSPEAKDSLLLVFEKQMAASGAFLMKQRQAFLSELESEVKRLTEAFALGAKVSLSYRPNVKSKSENLEEAISQAQYDARPLDMRFKFTTSGPHRDEVLFKLETGELRYRGSAGQHRLFALALKFAAGTLLARHRGESPLIILDEPFAQLDYQRAEALLQTLGQFEQWVATAAAAGAAWQNLPFQGRLFHMETGRVVACE